MKNKFKVLCVVSIAFVAFGCEKNKDQAGRAPPTGCQDRKAVTLGIAHPIIVAQADNGASLHWDASGTELKLARGQRPTIQIVRDENYGAPVGNCLTTPNYIRLSRDRTTPGANSYLIAAPNQIGSNDVKIGNYGPGATVPFGVHGRFLIEKVPGVAANSTGPEIQYGDEFRIRGVSQDFWLVVPANADVGTKVTLNQDVNLATRFTFPHR